jgi:cellulose synthase (UDP-forming)
VRPHPLVHEQVSSVRVERRPPAGHPATWPSDAPSVALGKPPAQLVPAPREERQAAGLAILAAIADKTRPVPVPHCQPQTGPMGSVTVTSKRQLLLNGVMLLIGLALAARFAVFWFSPARLPRDFGRGLDAWDVILFAGLTFVVWHRQTMDILSWLICRRVEPYRQAPRPEPGMRVAFITTFVPASESLGMLRQNLASILMADYPHDTWVLDEGNDPAVRAMCTLLGVKYFSRGGVASYNTARGRFMAKSKAGNHNAWYDEYARQYDIVAQVDSDFKVRRDFLTKTIGHFRNPRVAFVGTPQIYGNMDNFIARGAAQQTYMFYGPIMRALSRRKMTLLIGANHVVRVSALQDIGWYQGHLTEDLATGKRFHAGRWESVYVPEPLAVGEGPTSWTAYFNQQYRWAFGCMNIFFTHSPRLNIKMRTNHAMYYFLMEQFYFSGLTMAVALIMLMIYYIFGWEPARIQILQLAFWYLPLLTWRQLMTLWLQRFNIRPEEERGLLWAGRLLTIAIIPIYFLALMGVVRNRRVTWKTTPKGNASGREYNDDLKVFTPHLIASGVIVAGMCIALILGHTRWVFFAWGVGTSGLLSAFALPGLCRRLADSLRWQRPARRGVCVVREEL